MPAPSVGVGVGGRGDLRRVDLQFGEVRLTLKSRIQYGERTRALVALAKLTELGCSVSGLGMGLDVFESMGSGECPVAVVGDLGVGGLDRLRSRSSQ